MSREPSMEDILSSIRKVIAREDAPSTAPTRLARGEPAVEPDILELEDESPASEAAAPDELVAEDAAAAARRSLDALSAAVVAPEMAAPAIATAGSLTLDAVVTEALRPLLKAWLDRNLPPLVEAMVAKEIARITGRRI